MEAISFKLNDEPLTVSLRIWDEGYNQMKVHFEKIVIWDTHEVFFLQSPIEVYSIIVVANLCILQNFAKSQV